MVQNRSHRPPAPLSQLVTNSGAASAPGRRYWLHLRPYPHQLPAPPLVQVAMRSAPSTRPSVSIACVASMYMHAAVASISEEAMPSAPVSDSWEGPKRRDATGDAIFGSKFFDSNAPPYPPFRPWRKGGPKKKNRKPPRHCAALVRMVSGGAGTLNPSRLGARAAVEAVSIVHDVRYVA